MLNIQKIKHVVRMPKERKVEQFYKYDAFQQKVQKGRKRNFTREAFKENEIKMI